VKLRLLTISGAQEMTTRRLSTTSYGRGVRDFSDLPIEKMQKNMLIGRKSSVDDKQTDRKQFDFD